MPDRVILSIGTKKGLFVAEAAKARRSFALRGPFGPGVPVYATLIDTRGSPRLYASSCNPFFGMKVLVSTDLREKVQGDEVGPGLPEGGRASAREHLVTRSGRRQEGPVVRRRAGGAFPQPRRRRFLGNGAGHQQPRTRPQVAARQRRTVHAHDPARRQARPPRHLDRRPLPLAKMAARPSRRPTTASAPASRPIRIPSSASACTRSRATRTHPAGSTCRTTGAGANGTGRGASAGHRRAAQRRPWPHLAVDRQGAAARLRLPDRRASARRRHGLRHAARGADAHLSGRRAGGLAQRETAAVRGSGSRTGYPKKESFFTVLRDAMDIDDLKSPALYFGTTTGQLWIGRDGGEEWSCLFDFASADPLREGRGGLSVALLTLG